MKIQVGNKTMTQLRISEYHERVVNSFNEFERKVFSKMDFTERIKLISFKMQQYQQHMYRQEMIKKYDK